MDTSDTSSPLSGAKSSPSCSAGEVFEIHIPIPDEDAPAIKYMTQGQILFALSSFSKQDFLFRVLSDEVQIPNSASREGVAEIPCASVAPGVRSKFRSLAQKERYIKVLGSVKTDLFKSGDYNVYRNYNRKGFQIPETADKFIEQLRLGERGERLLDWNQNELVARGWQVDVKQPSRAKARSRAIFTYLHKDFRHGHPAMSIALTLEPQTLAPKDNPKILETEIIVDREPGTKYSKHSDFFVYDEAGQLSTCSVFFSGRRLVKGPSPHSCLGCHLGYANRSFQKIPESFKGNPVDDWSRPEYHLERLEAELINSCD